jgi:hypothetical protein
MSKPFVLELSISDAIDENSSSTHVARLMVTSWREKYPNNEQVETFIKYFIQQWLNPKRMGWFDHYVQHVPCQDNALESTNRYMRDAQIRPRLPINEFLAQIENGEYSF